MTTGNAKLTITDGTPENTASIMVTISGAHLVDWMPKSPPAANLIWASSPYLDGKHLVHKNFDNAIDTFTLDINAHDQDASIHKLRQFIILLNKAVNYWTDEFSTHKFWMEVRSTCETNVRYAYVIDYTVPEMANPYEAPFNAASDSVIEEQQINIEHTIWQDSLTIGDNCVQINNLSDQMVVHRDTFVPVLSGDDGYTLVTGSQFLNGGTFMVTGGAGAGASCFIRYRVNIPKDAVIIKAFLRLNGNNALAVDSCNLTIKVEDTVNPAILVSYADYWARARSAITAAWNGVAHIIHGGWYDSPDVTTLVGDITRRVGWNSGQYMQFFLENNASTAGAYREWHTLDEGTYIPQLVVEWAESLYPLGNTHGDHLPPTDVVTVGVADTCLKAPVVAPFEKIRGLSFVWTYDASLGTFGPNLAEPQAANQPLLPTVAMTTSDCLYAGISALGDALHCETFNSLAFNISALPANITSAVLEYWNGATWTSISYWCTPVNWPFSGTLGRVGYNYILWNLPSDWAQCKVNDVTGFWVRIRPSVLGANPTPPYQLANTPVYTVTQMHVEVSGDEIKGDINALIDFYISTMGTDKSYNYMICAKKYRDTNNGLFIPTIPAKEGGIDPPDATVTDGVAITTANSLSYAGYAMWWSPGLGATGILFMVDLGSKTYAGRYRVFMRVKYSAGMAAGKVAFRMQVENYISGYSPDTEYVYNKEAGAVDEIIDLGFVNFPYGALLEADVNNASDATLYIKGYSLAAGNTINIYDLILMPVDDFHVEISSVAPDTAFHYPVKLITSNPKTGPYAIKMYEKTETPFLINWNSELWYGMRAQILGSFQLEPEEKYWLYFLVYGGGWAPGVNEAFSYLMCPVLDKNQRYLLARGDE